MKSTILATALAFCVGAPLGGAIDAPTTAPIRVTLKGRVSGPDGAAVDGAIVTLAAGFPQRRSAGTQPVSFPAATTNSRGEFVVEMTSSAATLEATIESAGLATAVFRNLDPGDKVHELRMEVGATVLGRLLEESKPAGGVKVRLRRQNPIALTNAPSFDAVTDALGRFKFEHIPPPGDWNVSAVDLGARRAMKSELVRVDANGTVSDIGDLTIVPAFVLSGKISLTDGKPMPEKSGVYINNQRIALNDAGQFSLGGLLPGKVSITPSFKGYRPSRDNRSLNEGGRTLIGAIDRDISDLTILLEPGKAELPNPAAVRDVSPKDQEIQKRRIEGIAPEH